MRNWLALPVAAALAAACMGTTTPGDAGIAGGSGGEAKTMADDTGARWLTAADSGRSLRLRPGQTAQLRLRADTPEPRLEGDSVLLIETLNVAGGRREWELRAQRPGRSRIRVDGDPPLAFTIDVEGD